MQSRGDRQHQWASALPLQVHGEIRGALVREQVNIALPLVTDAAQRARAYTVLKFEQLLVQRRNIRAMITTAARAAVILSKTGV